MEKQRKILQTDNSQLDDNIKKTLAGTFPLPPKVAAAQRESFAKVRDMSKEKENRAQQNNGDILLGESGGGKSRRKIKKLLFRSFAGAAAVTAAAFCCIYIVNPSVAAQVPIVSHVFEQIGGALDFAGDYEKLAEPVQADEKGIESITIDGTNLTLSEVYCNGTALYLSLVVRSQEKIPDTFYDEDGKPMISMYGQIDFDFDEEGAIDLLYVGDSEVDGKLVDDNTFAGVIRFDMGQHFSDKGVEIPDNFKVQLSVPQIVGTKLHDTRPEIPKELRDQYEAAMEENGLGLTEEDYERFTEEQKDIEHQLFNDMWNAYYELYPDRQTYPNQYDNWFLYGPWDFAFDVAKNDEDIIRKEINDINENGLGIISVTKTPMEINVEMPENLDCFAAILDANGNLMGNEVPGYGNDVPVNGYDTSRIYVYICDYVEYMDELKGVWWSGGYDESVKGEVFKELLDERSLYSREIIFEEQEK